jgi:hypothetical protein
MWKKPWPPSGQGFSCSSHPAFPQAVEKPSAGKTEIWFRLADFKQTGNGLFHQPG